MSRLPKGCLDHQKVAYFPCGKSYACFRQLSDKHRSRSGDLGLPTLATFPGQATQSCLMVAYRVA